MSGTTRSRALVTICFGLFCGLIVSAQAPPARFADPVVALAEAGCTVAKLGDAIPASVIGEPAGGVTLLEPRWA